MAASLLRTGRLRSLKALSVENCTALRASAVTFSSNSGDGKKSKKSSKARFTAKTYIDIENIVQHKSFVELPKEYAGAAHAAAVTPAEAKPATAIHGPVSVDAKPVESAVGQFPSVAEAVIVPIPEIDFHDAAMHAAVSATPVVNVASVVEVSSIAPVIEASLTAEAIPVATKAATLFTEVADDAPMAETTRFVKAVPEVASSVAKAARAAVSESDGIVSEAAPTIGPVPDPETTTIAKAASEVTSTDTEASTLTETAASIAEADTTAADTVSLVAEVAETTKGLAKEATQTVEATAPEPEDVAPAVEAVASDVPAVEALTPAPEPLAESAPEAFAEPPPEVSAEPVPEASVEPVPTASVEPVPEASVEPAPKASVEPAHKASVEPPPEASAEPPHEASVEPAHEASAEPPHKASAELAPETSAKPDLEAAPTDVAPEVRTETAPVQLASEATIEVPLDQEPEAAPAAEAAIEAVIVAAAETVAEVIAEAVPTEAVAEVMEAVVEAVSEVIGQAGQDEATEGVVSETSPAEELIDLAVITDAAEVPIEVVETPEAGLDPIQKLFLNAIRDYSLKSKATGGIVDAGPQYHKSLADEIAKLQRLYGGGDLTCFPEFEYPQPKPDEVSTK